MNFKKIRTEKQLEKAWKDFEKEIESREMFKDNSETAKADRLKKSKKDIFFFAETYFPEYVRKTWGKHHKEFKKIRHIKNEIIGIEAFRESGKSTFWILIDTIYTILFGNHHYMLLSSITYDKSVIFTARVYGELKFNHKLKNDFSELIKGLQSWKQFDVTYKKKAVRIQAISIGQDPRGLVFKSRRPDYARLDDIQTRQKAKSPRFVASVVDWVLTDLFPALGDGFSCVLVGTPLNNRCVISLLKKGDKTQGQKPMRFYSFPLENDKGKSTWPEQFPAARIKRIKRQIGTLRFDQEFNLIAISLDEKKFKEKWIKYYDPAELVGLTFKYVFTRTDPAFKKADKNCYKAVIVGAITDDSKIYIFKTWLRRESVEQMVSTLFDYQIEFNPMYQRIEDNGGQALLEVIIKKVVKEKGVSINYKMETTTQNKDYKIEAVLSSPHERGEIFYNPECSDSGLLIKQLLQFPEGKFKDGPDALAELVQDLLNAMQSSSNKLPESRGRLESSSILRGF